MQLSEIKQYLTIIPDVKKIIASKIESDLHNDSDLITLQSERKSIDTLEKQDFDHKYNLTEDRH